MFGHIPESSNFYSTPILHSERQKKKTRTEEEMGKQYQRMNRDGLASTINPQSAKQKLQQAIFLFFTFIF